MKKHLSDILLALLLCLGVFLWQRTTFPIWMTDLFLNQLGAYYFKTGQYEWMYTPVYRVDAWLEHSQPIAEKLGNDGDILPFLYAPFVAAILSPFAEAPATHWRNIVFIVNFLLLFVFAYLIMKLCRAGPSFRAFLWALALVLLCYPMARATKLGQIVPILAAVTWATLLMMREGKVWLPGILLGLIGAVKLFPIALILLPLLDRRFKLAAVSIGTVICVYGFSVILFGVHIHALWWEVMREFGDLIYPCFGNGSLQGWLSRTAYGFNGFSVIPVAIPTLAATRYLFVAFFGGLTLAALWRIKSYCTGEQLALSSGLLLSAIFLCVPNAWEHYWLFVLPSLGWAIYTTIQKRDKIFWELWLGAASFFFLMKLTRFYYADTLFSDIISGSQMFGLLLLWIWFLRRARVERVALLPDTGATASLTSTTPSAT